MSEIVHQHPVLGRVVWDAGLTQWQARVDLAQDLTVALHVDTEASPDDLVARNETFEAAVEYLAWARVAEPKCRQQIADNLLNLYNTTWANHDPDDPGDGPGPVTRDEFIAIIRPTSLHTYPDGSGVWYYEDGDLFAGHWIEVWVSADKEFSGAHLAG